MDIQDLQVIADRVLDALDKAMAPPMSLADARDVCQLVLEGIEVRIDGLDFDMVRAAAEAERADG